MIWFPNFQINVFIYDWHHSIFVFFFGIWNGICFSLSHFIVLNQIFVEHYLGKMMIKVVVFCFSNSGIRKSSSFFVLLKIIWPSQSFPFVFIYHFDYRIESILIVIYLLSFLVFFKLLNKTNKQTITNNKRQMKHFSFCECGGKMEIPFFLFVCICMSA